MVWQLRICSRQCSIYARRRNSWKAVLKDRPRRVQRPLIVILSNDARLSRIRFWLSGVWRTFSLCFGALRRCTFHLLIVLTVRQRGVGAGIGAQEYLGFVKTAIRHARARRRRNQERHQDLRRRVRPAPLYLFSVNTKLTSMNRRKSDIENERLPPIDERQPPPASSNAIPGASANLGQSVSASAAPRANAVAPPPVTTFKRPKDGKAQRR